MSDSNRQQRQLAFLAEMTTNFQYIAGPLNAAADAMSCPPQAEEDSDEVCAVLQEDIPCHWDEQELLAAQQADKETLLAADRLVSTKQFAWPKQRGGPMKLLRRPKSPNVAARAVLLLPPAYRHAAMKALHEDTHAGQQQTIKMARDRYLWPGLGARHQEVRQVVYCVPESKNQQTRACQTRTISHREDSFPDHPYGSGRSAA